MPKQVNESVEERETEERAVELEDGEAEETRVRKLEVGNVSGPYKTSIVFVVFIVSERSDARSVEQKPHMGMREREFVLVRLCVCLGSR